jgi:PAS domain S-box-containing protein
MAIGIKEVLIFQQSLALARTKVAGEKSNLNLIANKEITMPTRLNNPEMSRNVMEQAAEAIIVVDNDNRVLYQNPEARQIFGYDDEELVGQTVHDSLHHHYVNGEPVPLEQCQVYRAAVYGEKARDFIWMMNRKNGEKIYVSGSSAPLYIAGAHVGAIFFANDITQRKQTEDAWQKASQQLQLAAEIGGIGLFDYYHDSGELVWSDTLKKQFGLPPDAPATLDTFFARLHPDDRERVKQHTEELARPESGGTFQHEYRVIGQEDGKERWIASKGRVFYENGKAVRQMGATIEITDRKLIEENLRHAAHHDPLTGLPNRAMLAEYAEHLLAMAERDGADSAVLFVDLDRFKPINDEHGHDAGDIVLQGVYRTVAARR